MHHVSIHLLDRGLKLFASVTSLDRYQFFFARRRLAFPNACHVIAAYGLVCASIVVAKAIRSEKAYCRDGRLFTAPALKRAPTVNIRCMTLPVAG